MALNTAVSTWFWRITADMPLVAFKNLFGACEKVFWWDPLYLATAPLEGRLPWFVAWLVGSHSKKFVYRSKPPSHSEVMNGVVDWGHRIRWKHFFTSNPEAMRPDEHRYMKSKRRIRPYPVNSVHLIFLGISWKGLFHRSVVRSAMLTSGGPIVTTC